MSLDIWSQIYTKLNIPLERYKSTPTNIKSEVIAMRRAQMELRLSWAKARTYHKDLVAHMIKDIDNEKEMCCDLCPHVMVVRIVMVSALDKYKKEHSQELKTETPKAESQTSDGSYGSARSSNGSTRSKYDPEEYVPAARTNFGSSLSYTPSTLSSNVSSSTTTTCAEYSQNTASDEYTPLTRITEDKIGSITYTPTTIDKVELKKHANEHKQKTAVATDINRNDFPEKRKRPESRNINDLFGKDSDGESENRANFRSKYERIAKQSGQTESPSVPARAQGNLNMWITTRIAKKKDASESDEANKKRKKDRPIELPSLEKPIAKVTGKDLEAKQLKALRREFDELDTDVTVDRKMYVYPFGYFNVSICIVSFNW